MKKSINKFVSILAGAFFIIALAINIQASLDDPFVRVGEVAMATNQGSCTQTGSTRSELRPVQGSACKDTNLEICGYRTLCAAAENGECATVWCV